MKRLKLKKKNILRKRSRIRSKISTRLNPRVSVHISNRHVVGQLISAEGKVLAYVSSVGVKIKGSQTEVASMLGAKLAGLIKEKKVAKIVFDRGSKEYRGKVKAFADAMRENGIKF